MATIRIATGTLTKKIQPQPGPSVSGPPSSAPIVPPTPPAELHAPSALLRSRPSLKVVIRIASPVGVLIAADIPCSTRAPISTSPDQASPHSNDDTASSAPPI